MLPHRKIVRYWQELPSWMKLVGAIVLMQGIWWGVLEPLLKYSPPKSIDIIREAQIAPLAEPTLDALANARLEKQSLTWSGCCEHRFYGARLIFDRPAGTSGDLALIPGYGADNYYLYVNGSPVRIIGHLYPEASYHGLLKTVLQIPADLVRDTGNEIQILTARNGATYTDLFAFAVGDYVALHENTRMRRFVMDELKLINTAIPWLIAIVSILLVGQSRNRRFLLWLAALAFFWGARNGFYLWTDFPFSIDVRRSYYFFITNALPVAWFGFVDAWAASTHDSKRWRYCLWTTITLGVSLCAFITLVTLSQSYASAELTEGLTENFGMLVTALAAVRLFWHLKGGHDERHWEAALFFLCMINFAAEMAQYIFGPFGHISASHSASLFLLAFLVAIVSRNVRLFESMEAFNKDLNLRLQASEAEIRDNYERLEQANRKATLAQERQRLLQDMHDGIGSQLVGLLAVVRGESSNLKLIETTLEDTLHDLRLIIDSLDSATDDLVVALGVFRSRVDPRLTAAGYECHWQLDALPMPLPCPPHVVLNLYRILQEAVSNSLKHGAGKKLSIAAYTQQQAEQLEVTLCIADGAMATNSVGGTHLPTPKPGQESPPSLGGQGLASMERRARAIGGSLQIESSESGTRVSVNFTIPQTTY